MKVSPQFRLLFAIGVLVSLASGAYFLAGSEVASRIDKIRGVNLESPPKPIVQAQMGEVAEIGSGWVAVIPYGFTPNDADGVIFDHPHQWWGEGIVGAAAMVEMAQEQSLKVMLKPQVWVQGSWVGDYQAKDTEGWKAWEDGYEAYIMAFAALADSLKVQVLCIGTEYRVAVKERPEFWHGLIAKIRSVYAGKLTYSANWDDYAEVPFWEELDFIGISAYFPITDLELPEAADMDRGWAPHLAALERYYAEHGIPILFTEYGYRSASGSAHRPWETRGGSLNLELQRSAYEALYRNVWHQPWFAGGFLWKWQFRPAAGGMENTDFTPQGKPAMDVVKAWYGA